MWGFCRSLPTTPQQKLISIGTAGTGVTASNYVSDRDIVTVLTFTGITVGTAGVNANKAIGALVYTFPAGAHIHIASYMSVAFTYSTPTPATIDTGIGSVIASGAVATLDGTAGFEDYITGQAGTAQSGGGSAVVKTSVATAGALVGISINEAAGVKAVHLNLAATWPDEAAVAVTATGQITLKWIKLS